MKLKKDFVLREVAGSFIVLAVGKDTLDFDGMLSLNESGALLWRTLEKEADKDMLVEALMQEYEVEREEASADVEVFLDKLSAAGCLEIF